MRYYWNTLIYPDNLSDIYSDILSYFFAGNLLDIYSDIVSDVLPDVFSGILSGILFEIYFVILWRNQRIITTQPQSSEYHRQIILYEEHASSELAQASAAVSPRDREINALGMMCTLPI